MSDALPLTIAYLGGGSRGWARTLMGDLALTPELTGEIRLYDIDHAASAANVARAAAIFAHPEARTRFAVQAFPTPEQALAGADIVVISITPGPATLFANDLAIPARHGVVQTVGDTTGPGGISRSLRAVPIFADYARRIMRCCPRAWVINYTNPMTLCTQAMHVVEPAIRAIGCCHEVFGTRAWVASMVAAERGISLGRNDIDVEVAGLNHFTFFTRAAYRGEDAFPAVRRFMARDGFFRDRTADALAREAKGRYGSCDGLIQLEFLRRFGVIGAAGDRHLVEFVPWWIGSVAELRRWGVSVTGPEQRLKHWRPPEHAAAQDQRAIVLKRSKEEGVDLLLALAGRRPLDTNLNLPNRGQIAGLPEGHVVETLAAVRRDAVTPLVARPLPPALHAGVERIARCQQLTLRAALARDRELALQAMLADPIVTIPTDRVAAMLDELLAANAALLPGWERAATAGAA